MVVTVQIVVVINMKCTYCGESEATERINNPNMDEKELSWDVCNDCKDVIKQQQLLSYGAIFASREYGKEFGEKMISDAKAELKKIADRTKKPIMCAVISKKEDGGYESSSVTFTGKGDDKK